jgi:hypothetical protein
MKLTGREIQALLGATTIHGDVSFIESSKPVLSQDEDEAVEAVRRKMLAARRGLGPPFPRHAPGWLDQMLTQEAELALSVAEARVLEKVAAACLAEVKTDGGLSAFAGPGVDLEALRTAQAKIAENKEKGPAPHGAS